VLSLLSCAQSPMSGTFLKSMVAAVNRHEGVESFHREFSKKMLYIPLFHCINGKSFFLNVRYLCVNKHKKIILISSI
jgi:hypothetical protein